LTSTVQRSESENSRFEYLLTAKITSNTNSSIKSTERVLQRPIVAS